MIAELILLIIFIVFFFIGFFIIFKQVSLVKKGEITFKNKILCIIYGFIFSVSIMIVMAMAFIFAAKTPDFWKNSPFSPPDITPFVLQIPFIICLIYISIYPLGDFLFIALSKESDEGLTIFHKYLNKYIINRVKSKKGAIIIAILFYLTIFIIPPIIISLLGVPFILIWISWMLFYPLMILTYYGSKGYIAGISNAYYHLPYLERSIFIGFEDPERNLKEFLSDPFTRIIIGLMTFVFVWAWISLFQTIGFFFTGKLAVSTYSYSGMVFVTLLFGIVGYFTRFWGRKIKYRSIDIYFAAYLMAAVGINVLVNFLIVNITKLTSTFNIWFITSPIPSNFLLFAWPAIIEELILIIFTSYYFLVRNNNFIQNLKFSKITESGETFDPIPLFNFIRHKNPKLRDHARSTLKLMYERIPLKAEINLNQPKYKNPLMDGICDPDPEISNFCYSILLQLENDVPEICLNWIIKDIKTPNYDKSKPLVRSLLETNLKGLENIPSQIIFDLIKDPEWRLQIFGLKLLLKFTDYNKNLEMDINIEKLMKDSNKEVQVLTLEILSKTSYKASVELLLDKINHPSKEIRTAAIKNLKDLSIEEVHSNVIDQLVSLLNDPSNSVKASIFEVLANLGNFKKLKISIDPFMESLMSSDKNLRKNAIFAIEKYFDERPKDVNLDLILENIDDKNPNILSDIFTLLGHLWEKDEKRIIKILVKFIKSDHIELQEKILQIINENFDKNPKLILQELMKVEDESKFISKGIIARTLIRVSSKNPEKVIPRIIKYLDSTDNNERLNAITALDGLINDYYPFIKLDPILDLINSETEDVIKKEAYKILSKIAKKEPKALKSNIDLIFNAIRTQESILKNTLVRSLLEISRESPEIIDPHSIKGLIEDNDPFIRETGIKILGNIASSKEDTKSIIEMLRDVGLKDEEWSVREAAVKSLGMNFNKIKNKELVLNSLISALNDSEGWVRKSTMDLIAEIEEINPKSLPFNQIIENLRHKDPKVREAAANLLKRYDYEKINKIFTEILNLLEDNSEEVRKSMINSLVMIINEIGLSKLLNRLLQNLSDEGSLELQRSISIILKKTAKYSDEDIKKRIIALLKIRCEMSQDPVICGAFHQIKES